MAKKNEENLSRLSRDGLYQKLKDFGTSKSRRIYKYNEATPEMLEEIRSRHTAENKRIRTKKIALFSFLVIATSIAVYVGVMFVF
ncbi:MAG: hypothetical protein JXR03_15340 [Cyclobacteriaceae bacterium]